MLKAVSYNRRVYRHMLLDINIRGQLVPLSIALVVIALGLVFVLEKDPDSFEGKPRGSLQPASGQEWKRIDNPGEDGWKTEVTASQISDQLKQVSRLIQGTLEAPPGSRSSIAAESFACGGLRPENFEVVFDDSSLEIKREKPGTNPPALSYRGASGLEKSILDFSRPWKGNGSIRASFKVYGVQQEEGRISSRQHLSILVKSEGGNLEEHSTWDTLWVTREPGGVPLLTSIKVSKFEQARTRNAAPLLADQTHSVLGANPSFRRQFQLGLNHWLNQSQDNRFFDLLGTPGLALGDVNGDGLDDLYVCQEGGLPNRLYLRRPDGTAIDHSEASRADWLESSRAALIVDLDNDGNQDLAVTILGALVLAAGDGKGGFAIRACLPTSNDTMSLAAADPDLDGDLDIYVCAHKADDLSQDAGVVSIAASEGFIYHDANNAAANLLFRNDIPAGGDWAFTDITKEAGLDQNNRRFSFAAAWEDYDNDGDADLYVANDFGRNNLYRNDGNLHFTDVAAGKNAEDSASGMSVSWSDYDRDGVMDLYVSNMFSAAGRRVTSQQLFKPGASALVRKRLQRFARGNTLLRGRKDAAFSDESLAANVNMGRWAWASSFVDLNADGWDDLVVANGYITTEDTGDL